MKKSDNNKTDRSMLKKIICFITVAAMAIACFYNDGVTNKCIETYAADVPTPVASGALNVNRTELLTYLTPEVSGTDVSCIVRHVGDHDELEYGLYDAETEETNIVTMTLNSGENLRVYNSNVTCYQVGETNVSLDNSGNLYILGTYTGGMTNRGDLYVYGTMTGGVLYNAGDTYLMPGCGVEGMTEFYGNGNLYADSFSIDSKCTNRCNIKFYVDDLTFEKSSGINGGEIYATNSLTFSGFSTGDSYGPSVHVQSGTKITTSGIRVTLSVDDLGKSILIDGDYYDGMPAGWLFKEEPTVASDIPEILYGQSYNALDYLTTNSDGTKSVMFASYQGPDEYSEPYSTPPTDVGQYRAYYSVAESDTYRPIEMWDDDFTIRYLTTDIDSNMKATVSGTYVADGEDRYYSTPVTVTSNTGFKIRRDPIDYPDSEFVDSFDIEDDGYYYGVLVAFRRNDGATSDREYVAAFPYYIDQTPPEVISDSVIDENEEKPDVEVEDGAQFHAKRIEFDIQDGWGSEEGDIYPDALTSVTVNGEEVGVGDGIAHIVMSTNKGTKAYEIVARDKAGNTTSMNLSIEYKKDVPVTTLSMPDVYLGSSFNPVVTTDSDQDESEYTYYYKKKGADDSTYSETEPTAVGDYTVKVEIPYTEYYAASQAEADFTVSYLESPETSYTLSGTEGKNGFYRSDVSLYAPEGYTISSSPDGTFGEYVAYNDNLEGIYLKRSSDGALTGFIAVSKVLIDKTYPYIPEKAFDADGYEVEMSEDSTVKAKSLSFSVADENLATVTANGKEFEVADGNADVYIEAKSGEVIDVDVTAEDEAGNVSKRSFKLESGIKKVPTASVSLSDYYVGQSFEPTFSSDSDGKDKVVFEYKYQSADDSTYTTTKPFAAGKYTVRATTPETEEYKGYSCTDDFELSYLTAPKDAYTLTGKPGKNDYYITDVYVNAPDGFAVASTFRGTYQHSVLYTASGQKVYLQRTEDGALTDAITVVEKCKIDKDSPTFQKGDNGGAISNKTTVFADEYTVSVSDEHIALFTVDGSKVSGTSATLDPENGIKEFTLKAEDEAGNTASMSIILMATWLKDKIIPANKRLPLQVQESYKLDGGYWSVDGDSTVYTGGGEVYVKSDGDYTFTKVN